MCFFLKKILSKKLIFLFKLLLVLLSDHLTNNIYNIKKVISLSLINVDFR
jgi:hypothetical protein